MWDGVSMWGGVGVWGELVCGMELACGVEYGVELVWVELVCVGGVRNVGWS